MVFHAPQSGHLPTQREVVAPQEAQTKIGFGGLFTAIFYSPGTRPDQAPVPFDRFT